MKNVFCILLLLFFSGFGFAAKVATFPELVNPQLIYLDDDRIYITQDINIFVYSRKDFKLQNKFGEEGEGPREFKGNPFSKIKISLSIQPDHIVVDSLRKVSLFTKEGKFLKEMKVARGYYYRPIGKRYLGNARLMNDKAFHYTLNIFDSNFKEIKQLYKEKSWYQMTGDLDAVANRTPSGHICGDKIVVAGDKIYIYDLNGKKLHTIDYKFDKVKVTSQDKKDYLDYFKKSVELIDFYPYMKGRLMFSGSYPNFRSCTTGDNKIYVLTYKKKDDRHEFVIFDLKGKFLKKVMLPFRFIDLYVSSPYKFKDDTLFQLIENEDDLSWELHSEKVR